MKYEEYRISKKEKLEDLAWRFELTIQELQELNPTMETFKNFWGTETYAIVNQLIKVPTKETKNALCKESKSLLVNSEEERFLKNPIFDQQARYRCEQINVSKVDGNTVHYVDQKFQYLLEQSIENKIGKVKLEEHLYNFSPAVLNLSFEFISKTEFIKNNVIFNFSLQNGRVEKIINKPEINSAWIKFRDNDFEKSEFIKRLRQSNPKAVEELKTLGNKQFSINYNLAEEEYRRNLFYFICFDKFLIMPYEDIKSEDFPFMSTIVPPVVVPIEFRYDKISEEKGILKLRKVGTLKLNPELIKDIEKKYDEIHKPNIKYSFTEYKLEFRVRLEYNIEEKLIETADLFIMEQIADNIDNTCEFHLKRLHNYKP